MARYLRIVLKRPLDQHFTYENLDEFKDRTLVGFRVKISFNGSRTKGFVVGEMDELPPDPGFDVSLLRKILGVIDEKPAFSAEALELARWVSQFYVHPLGETLAMMIPDESREQELDAFAIGGGDAEFRRKELSEEQAAAVAAVAGAERPGVHYIYGATGTGKTEVFLSIAEKILAEGRGAIYLVPEIALTRQVAEAVKERFGETVAVLHSGLTPKKKKAEWGRILSGEARVVVGARSAVFAPVKDLGLIIIDEEHDGSYKSNPPEQTSPAPRYHARQVAMHRCSAAGIPLVMGSATPSVEAWKLMRDGAISAHVLSRRLAGGAMPKIRAVDLTLVPQDAGAISPELRREMEATLAEGRQTILFLNRRGFSHYFRCSSCGYEMKCRNCSVSLTLHKSEKRLRCHYCGWSVEQPQKCPGCGSLDIGWSGFGTEFVEGEVRAKFPNARILRLDTDSVPAKEIPERIDEFRRGEWDILLGTQMVAKGLNFPRLKLVGVVQADIGLHMPDFRASERTFSLITQVAGRAGRFFPDGKVIVQTYQPSEGPVAMAVAGRTNDFYAEELSVREATGFPPFSRLVRIVFRSPSEEFCAGMAEAGAALLGEILGSLRRRGDLPESARRGAEEAEILGPSECPLAKVSDTYRNQILLRGPNVSVLQAVARRFMFGYRRPGNIHVECDVDPTDLL